MRSSAESLKMLRSSRQWLLFVLLLCSILSTNKPLTYDRLLLQRIDALLTSVLSSQPMSKEAMVDVLKLVFNLLLQYPRMVDADSTGKGKGKEKADERPNAMGEQWDEKFEPCVPPFQ